jgi:hypothetical protein
MRLFITALFAGLVCHGTADAQAPKAPIGKIAVTESGSVSYNGTPVTLGGLKIMLKDLKRANGVVWYYRESAAQEPPPVASEVVKLIIIDQQLPVTMSTKPDYSDVVMPDGTTRPRAH